MKVYIGIDWSQNKHDLCVLNQAGACLAQLVIAHSQRGFWQIEEMRNKLGAAKQDCLVGLETAHNILIDFLWDQGYEQVFVLPPSLVKGSRSRFGQSGARSDISDALLIADILRTDQGRLHAWLLAHPEIEIISRDRSFEYKAGIEKGAPQALQVVDRWHLLHNLQEKLQEVIPAQLKSQKTDQKQKETPSYRKRRKYFELVHYLDGKGHSQRLIARVLGISRGTVRRYLELADVPDWKSGKHPPSRLDAYRDYLRMRWDGGCRDITLLWKELQHKGYTGKRKSVAEYLQRFRIRSPFRSTSQLTWLFMKDGEGLQEEERNHLNSLLIGNQKLQEIYLLMQSFRKLLTQRSPQELDDWLLKMENCGVKKLQNFAASLRQDYEAVKAALTYDWSNGQVEGQVNRLKTIKHQMYGRAKFDLLRLRILGPP